MDGPSSRRLLFGVALAVFAADQLSKYWVQHSLALWDSRPVWGEHFKLTYILNPHGLMGLSLGPAGRYLMLPMAVLALAAVVYFHIRWRNKGILATTALGLIMAGAAGNILDRLRLGAVVDFIDCDIPDIIVPRFQWWVVSFPGYQLDRWYAFNIADSAVLVGVSILILLSLRAEKAAQPA